MTLTSSNHPLRATFLALGLVASLTATGCNGKSSARPQPSSSVQVRTVLTASVAHPSTDALGVAAKILASRLRAAAPGSRVAVSTTGSQLVVLAPASLSSQLPALAGPGLLEFRKVLETGPGDGPTPAPTGSVRTGAAYTRSSYAGLACAGPATPRAESHPHEQIVACDKTGTEKFHLDVAKVLGIDLQSAKAGKDQYGTENLIELRFTPAGQERWTALTVEACGSAAAHSPCPNGGQPTDRVAIVVDGVVYSAPSIREPIVGPAQITGSFTKAEAEGLAGILRYGALPFGFTVSTS